MVASFVSIGIYLLNGLIGFQDFKERSISAWIVPVLILSFAFVQIENNSYLDLVRELSSNLMYLLIILGGILLYGFLKYRSFVNPFDRLMGWGDVWIILAFAFILDTQTYIFFLTSTSILSLVIALGMKFRSPQKQVLFPLAGMMSFIYIFLSLINYSLNQEFLFTSIDQLILIHL